MDLKSEFNFTIILFQPPHVPPISGAIVFIRSFFFNYFRSVDNEHNQYKAHLKWIKPQASNRKEVLTFGIYMTNFNKFKSHKLRHYRKSH